MGDKYSISSRSGRLKKKVRIKKAKKKTNIFSKFFNFIKNPWVVFVFVTIFGITIYYLIGETGKKSGRSPAENAKNVNQVVKEKKGK
jgi:Trk-type K+ transport system membrane component